MRSRSWKRRGTPLVRIFNLLACSFSLAGCAVIDVVSLPAPAMMVLPAMSTPVVRVQNHTGVALQIETRSDAGSVCDAKSVASGQAELFSACQPIQPIHLYWHDGRQYRRLGARAGGAYEIFPSESGDYWEVRTL
jgi:hypothetical protein